MIGQVREKDQNEIRRNKCERDARLADGLTIFQLTKRIQSPRTEDAAKKLPLPGPLVPFHFIQQLARSSIGFVFEHRFDLIAQLGRTLVPVH